VSSSRAAQPSAFFARHRVALRDAARLGPIVDLACGRGRHALAAARAGLRTLAIDHNAGFLEGLASRARSEELPLQCVRFDLEVGLELPVRASSCGAILVFRFLHRPLAPAIEHALAPGGVLLYETFTTAQLERGTGPRSPAFLLEPGELPRQFPGLEVLAHSEGPRLREGPEDEDATARLFARKPG
jgi:SAM-dependent methyltransferase